MQKLIEKLNQSSRCSFSSEEGGIQGWINGEAFAASPKGTQIRFEYDRMGEPLMTVEAPEMVVLAVVDAIISVH